MNPATARRGAVDWSAVCDGHPELGAGVIVADAAGQRFFHDEQGAQAAADHHNKQAHTAPAFGATRSALRVAYRAGKRSSMTGVDADDALARWSQRNCGHGPGGFCDLEHAWYDGFEWDCRDLRPPFMERGHGDQRFTRTNDGWQEVSGE